MLKQIYAFASALLLAIVAVPRDGRAQDDYQAPTVSISVLGTSPNPVTIEVRFCDNMALNATSRQFTLDGVSVKSSFSYTTQNGAGNCYRGATSVGNFSNLTTGTHTITASIRDGFANVGTGSQSFYYGPPPPPPVAVGPANLSLQKFAGSTQIQTFQVVNTSSTTHQHTIAVQCSGAVATCTAPSTLTVSPSSVGQVDATYTVGPAGTGPSPLQLTATLVGDPSNSGSATVTVRSILPPTVTTFDAAAPSAIIARDQCLTISAGSAAAYECGDLRLVHALPTVRALNKSYTPTLIYNSQHAHPFPYIERFVTLSAPLPSRVTMTLTLNGVTYTREHYGSDWVAGEARRISIGFDAQHLPTGVHSYRLEVKADAVVHSDENGELVIVNRSNKPGSPNPFGAGWWLAGLEQVIKISGGRKLWIGGDGSARIYAPDGPNRWVAPNVDRPDIMVDSAGYFLRRLPNGVGVLFDTATGQHVRTVNSRRHEMRFGYLNGRLATMALYYTANGVTSGTNLNYTLAADPSYPDRIRSISDGGRTVTIDRDGERVTSLRDPDGTVVSFGYVSPGTSNRITWRRDRRLMTTYLSYSGTGQFTQSHMPGDAVTPAITTRFRSVEYQAAYLGRPLAPWEAYTQVDGPRHDVGDSTLFWLTRFGGVRRIRNPLSQETVILRGDPQWPALVTETRRHDGFTQRAEFDSTGHLKTTVVVNPTGSGDAVSTYEWNKTWDEVTKVTSPTNEVVRFDYDATGNRLWEQPGDDVSRRVTYTYTAYGLVETVSLPGKPAETFAYDPFTRNLTTTRSPMGYWTRVASDAFGRDTLLVTPTQETQPSLPSLDQTGLRQRIVYDAVDQDTLTMSISPAFSFYADRIGVSGGAPAQTLTIRKRFDEEGNPKYHKQWSTPNLNGIDTVTTSWIYDAANRLLEEHSGPNGVTVKRHRYDPAGNDTAVVMPSGHRIRLAYDALNRPLWRVTESRYFAEEYWPGLDGANITFPKDEMDGFTTPRDSAVFEYDPATGGMRTANNVHARITRTFYPSGAIKTERQSVGTAANPQDFSLHQYEVAYAYDLSGRRTRLVHPSNLRPTNADSVRYTYHPVTGALESVTDPLGHRFDYVYNVVGQLETLTMPGNIVERRLYDDDGRLTNRTEGVPGQPLIHDDTLSYDARGRATRVAARIPRSLSQYGIESYWYSGLGYLIGSQTQADATSSAEFYTRDAVGNIQDRDTWTGGNLRRYRNTYVKSSNRLSSTHRLIPGVGHLSDSIRNRFDNATGDIDWTYREDISSADAASPANRVSGTRSWHSTDGKLMGLQRWVVPSNSGIQEEPPGVYETYRYDALGRRVWVRSEMLCQDASQTTSCKSAIRRMVWDGSQILYEIRTDGAPGAVAVEDDIVTRTDRRHMGRVAYTHGQGIDRPLSFIRLDYRADGVPITVIPHQTWRGLFDSGTFPDEPGCGLSTGRSTGCYPIDWPAAIMNTFFDAQKPVGGPPSWFGSLIEEKQDASGLMYMRNRYYDPKSGRFTQEDPIGLAGGLNSYGFAAGDPVNFSDPFGLCPQCGVGAIVGVASGWAIAQLTGEEYGVGDALGDAALGAATGGISHLAKVAKIAWYSRRIGATGKVGEAALRRLGGESQRFFRTSSGAARYVDQLVNGIAHESKTGRMSLTKKIAEQIAKDVDLVQSGQVKGVVWHFFRSPVTNEVGATKPLIDALAAAGIKVVVH